MTEFLEPHKVIDLDRFGFAHSIDIITSEVDEHDMFCAILVGVA